ncbi:MAG: hypothetical protein AB1735_11985 [Pseudomonadota bacterium]
MASGRCCSCGASVRKRAVCSHAMAALPASEGGVTGVKGVVV